MLKQIWTVRSLRSLIWGLSFTAALVSLGYAALCCAVLDNNVPAFPGEFESLPVPARLLTMPKWALLAVPAVSLLFCILLRADSKRKELPPFLRSLAASSEPVRERQLSLFLDAEAGTCFLCVLFFFLCSLIQTNIAKELEVPAETMGFLLTLVLIALVVWWIASFVRIRRVKRER